MRTRDNGGPAFPGKRYTGQVEYVEGVGPRHVYEPTEGMTLRDYFAAKALPAEMARWSEGHPNGWEGIAAGCYAIADAMVKARGA